MMQVVANTINRLPKLSWHRSLVVLPGFKTAAFSAKVYYTVMAINMDYFVGDKSNMLSKLHFDTVCGLEYLLVVAPAAIKLYHISSPSDGENGVDGSLITVTLGGLRSGTNYKIAVWSTCDDGCLQQLSKESPSAAIACTETTRCQAITFIYSPTTVKTSGSVATDDESELKTDSFVQEIVSVACLLVTGIICVLLLFAWQYNTKLKHAAATRLPISPCCLHSKVI